MPYCWMQAPEYLEHAGVRVYHIFKDDMMEHGPRTYWYGLTPDCSDSGPCFGEDENALYSYSPRRHGDGGNESV